MQVQEVNIAVSQRIGILTITHSLMNYGNRLQNYALQKTLAKMGYDAKTVAYTPSYEGVLRPAMAEKKRSALVRKFRAMAKKAITSAMAAYRSVIFSTGGFDDRVQKCRVR